MLSSKHIAMLGIVGALAVGVAAPTYAQNYYGDNGYYGYYFQHTVPHFGYYPAREGGECFVTTDPTLGFGYWGSCQSAPPAIGRGSGSFKSPYR